MQRGGRQAPALFSYWAPLKPELSAHSRRGMRNDLGTEGVCLRQQGKEARTWTETQVMRRKKMSALFHERASYRGNKTRFFMLKERGSLFKTRFLDHFVNLFIQIRAYLFAFFGLLSRFTFYVKAKACLFFFILLCTKNRLRNVMELLSFAQ